MAFGGFAKGADGAPMAEINMIPLIDVMLVLLVIFIITAPLLTHSVKIDLPKASSTPNLTKPENIQLAVDAEGRVYWNGESLERDAWRSRMKIAAKQSPQPEVHIRGDKSARYEFVGRVVVACQRVGIVKVGFITEPLRPGAV